MRITILTLGSRGDVQPYVALGAGLREAGHRVRLVTHRGFEPLVLAHGMEYFEVRGDPRAILEGESGRRWLESGRNPFTFIRRMLDTARPVLEGVLSDYWRACQDSDLILYPVFSALIGASIAEKLGLRAYPAYLYHVHRTRAYPSIGSFALSPLGGWSNWLSYPLTEQIFWQFLRPIVNAWRVETLGLPPIPLRGPFGEWAKQRLFTLYGFSPNVLPKPPEWGDEVHITGYWFLDQPEVWSPPPELLDFLDSGPPPVSIGFGSMTDRDPAAVAEIALEALAQSGQRGVLLTGWAGLSSADLPDEVFCLESAPHDWLFPRMAAVVHHGGAGTTAAGLRAGVPSVLVPFFGDQLFWGWRVAQMGVGPSPLPRRRLGVRKLAQAIQAAVTDRDMRLRAADLGRTIRAEDGVRQAVAALEREIEQKPAG